MINKNSNIPMYIQISNILKKEIKEKSNSTELMATQQELVVRFSVSLITIRQALKLLEDDGLIIRKAGKGTFTTGKVVKEKLETLKTVNKVIIDEGNISVKVLEMREIVASGYIDDEVIKEIGEECLYILRLHLVDNKAICLSEIFVPKKYSDILNKERIEESSTYYIFRKFGKIELGDGNQVIRANAANEIIAKNLKVAIGSPILQIERKSYDINENLFEYIKIYYEYDKYEVTINMKLSI